MAYIKVRKDFIENTGITNGDFRLLCLLIERKGYFSKKYPISFPCTRDWLAEQLGYKNVKDISVGVSRLEKGGYICVDRKVKNNRYMLNQKAYYVTNTIFAVVDPALIYDKWIGDRDFRVLCWLLMHRFEVNRNNYVYELDYNPKEIADALNMSSRTVDRAIKVLSGDKIKYIIFTGKNKFFIHPNLIPFKSKIPKKTMDKDFKAKWLEEHKTGQKYPYITDEEYCQQIDKWFTAS